MSGFSAEWLALREPVDHASVNHQVRSELIRHLAAKGTINIVDLGSGTGSNFRSLSVDLPQSQNWTLVDIDTDLLAIAAKRCSETATTSMSSVQLVTRAVDLAGAPPDELLEGADLVTASALFDLVSTNMIEQIARATVTAGASFYTTLSYDGIASWLPEHPAHAAMRQAFNAHQRTDKGFGPAAGPSATAALAAAFKDLGYRTMVGSSPWILDHSQSKLRNEVDRGWAAAVGATGQVPEADIQEWLDTRTNSVDAISIIGHTDLLALPPRPVSR